MNNAKGIVFKFGDNVDTDVIIPARYLNSSDPAELATHCMEDIDKDFIKNVKKGDIIVAEKNFGCGSSREHAPIAIKATLQTNTFFGVVTSARKPNRNLPTIPSPNSRNMPLAACSPLKPRSFMLRIRCEDSDMIAQNVVTATTAIEDGPTVYSMRRG